MRGGRQKRKALPSSLSSLLDNISRFLQFILSLTHSLSKYTHLLFSIIFFFSFFAKYVWQDQCMLQFDCIFSPCTHTHAHMQSYRLNYIWNFPSSTASPILQLALSQFNSSTHHISQTHKKLIQHKQFSAFQFNLILCRIYFISLLQLPMLLLLLLLLVMRMMEKLEVHLSEYSILAILDKRKLQLLTQHPPPLSPPVTTTEQSPIITKNCPYVSQLRVCMCMSQHAIISLPVGLNGNGKRKSRKII